MVYSLKRWQIRTQTFYYLRCGAKTITFLFWASLYMVVMKMTVFKSHAPKTLFKDVSFVPENYSKWVVRTKGSVVLSESDPQPEPQSELEPEEAKSESVRTEFGWPEPDNATALELEMRVARVKRVCRERSLTNQPVNSMEFFVDHAHNLVWCNIFKAASSYWMYYINILGGNEDKYLTVSKQTPLTLARTKFPRPRIEEVQDAVNTPGVITLIVVREPFVRLLSAYRDKLENNSRPYYRKIGRVIVSKHRTNSTKLFGPIKSIGPTFYEFVAYLIQSYKETKQDAFDEHWKPYYSFCSTCAVNFNVIAKVETLSSDSAYVIQQLSLGHVLPYRVQESKAHLKTILNRSRDGKTTSALLKRYFKQLDEKMLNGLLEIYGIDFEMFGYDPTVYRSYVRK